MEGASSNVVLASDLLNNFRWLKGNTGVTGDADTSPDGTMAADRITINSSAHALLQVVTVLPSTTYTLSFYAKNIDADDAGYSIYDRTLSTNIIPSTSYISQLNTSTYTRVSVSFTTSPTTTGLNVFLMRDTGSTGSLLMWGVQLEPLPFPSSYIRTVTSTVTRSADSITVPAANIPAPTADYTWGATYKRLGTLPSGTTRVLYVAGESIRDIRVTNTTDDASSAHTTLSQSGYLTPGVSTKLFAVKDPAEHRLYNNGVSGTPSAVGTVTGSATAIGVEGDLFGHMKNLLIFDKALTQAQINQL